MEPPHEIVRLCFYGGPWDGRVLKGQDPPQWFRIEGEGSYDLVGYAQDAEGLTVRYAWR